MFTFTAVHDQVPNSTACPGSQESAPRNPFLHDSGKGSDDLMSEPRSLSRTSSVVFCWINCWQRSRRRIDGRAGGRQSLRSEVRRKVRSCHSWRSCSLSRNRNLTALNVLTVLETLSTDYIFFRQKKKNYYLQHSKT